MAFDAYSAPAPMNQRHLREKLSLLIDRLICVLDEIEDDPDLEDGHDLEEVCEDEGAFTGDMDFTWSEKGFGPQ